MDLEILDGRFELLERIGSGGVSTVYRARDTKLHREIAVKILHPHLAQNDTLIRQFTREIAITRTIDHPGIARYFELFESESMTYLTLEYLSGGDLKNIIDTTGALPVDESLRIAFEVLDALAAAHRCGVIHRDIKPHNILLDSDGHIRITDFGLAQTSLYLALQDTDSAGTPDYVAPETSGDGYSDARSDLYSFAVTMFELLTGVLPFRSNSPYQTLWKQIHDPAPSMMDLVPSLPDTLDKIVLKALEKDPSDRYQTAMDFADALRTLAPPAPPEILHSHACSVCGEQILDAFPYCIACNNTEVVLSPPTQSEPAHRVVIVGPGKAGDRLDPTLRHKLLLFLSSVGASAPSLDKKFPRLPFVLFRNLSEGSALGVVEQLALLGIDCESSGRRREVKSRRVSHLLTKKVFALYPRILMIGLCSAGGLWSSLGRASPVALLVFAGIIVVCVPVLLRFLYGQASVRRIDSRLAMATRVLVSPAARIKTPQIKRLIQRIAGKMDLLIRYNARDTDSETYEESVQSDIRSAISGILPELCDLLKYVASLEEEREKLSVEEVEVRRNIDYTLQRYIDSFLRFSATVDRISVGIAGSKALSAVDLEKDLGNLSEELAIDSEARYEVEMIGSDTALGQGDL